MPKCAKPGFCQANMVAKGESSRLSGRMEAAAGFVETGCDATTTATWRVLRTPHGAIHLRARQVRV